MKNSISNCEFLFFSMSNTIFLRLIPILMRYTYSLVEKDVYRITNLM